MDRFINTMVFTKYSKNDMIDLFKTEYNPEKFDNDVIDKFISLSHNTPRKFKALVTRFDYYGNAQGKPLYYVDSAYFSKFMSHIGMDEHGFNALQQQYINILKALNSPASLTTLANLMELQQEVITQIVEPDIIASGLVTISSSGRSYRGE
jgi:Holliday junction resolvasome RuvABC ATP-dependent DNA helicase subunit